MTNVYALTITFVEYKSFIAMNREREEEEEAPILYYRKGRVGTTVNDKVS